MDWFKFAELVRKVNFDVLDGTMTEAELQKRIDNREPIFTSLEEYQAAFALRKLALKEIEDALTYTIQSLGKLQGGLNYGVTHGKDLSRADLMNVIELSEDDTKLEIDRLMTALQLFQMIEPLSQALAREAAVLMDEDIYLAVKGQMLKNFASLKDVGKEAPCKAKH
ncbi:hypothetical protein THMIRHAS_12440 [Thiosulfatimonas sediminis]|uniref:Uncharacterized protein n=1 Tax=Thiosulfatimonas sediminis TaxID=2675054 RepID=A0A6F8PUR4_9GAMM|nr:hypothetical protein [Thiosulfatimonas sediminis]BBP45871.1 hypothetical protein THMIRHAS_12440 [Thiosulfatimonas sediminis]